MSRAIGKQKQTWVDENGVEMKIRQQKKKKENKWGQTINRTKEKWLLIKRNMFIFHFLSFYLLFLFFPFFGCCFVFIEYAFCAFRIYDGLSTCDVVLFFNYFSASFTCRFSNGGRSHMRWKYFLSFSMFDILFILRTAPVSHGIWQYSEYEYPIR